MNWKCTIHSIYLHVTSQVAEVNDLWVAWKWITAEVRLKCNSTKIWVDTWLKVRLRVRRSKLSWIAQSAPLCRWRLLYFHCRNCRVILGNINIKNVNVNDCLQYRFYGDNHLTLHLSSGVWNAFFERSTSIGE